MIIFQLLRGQGLSNGNKKRGTESINPSICPPWKRNVRYRLTIAAIGAWRKSQSTNAPPSLMVLQRYAKKQHRQAVITEQPDFFNEHPDFFNEQKKRAEVARLM